MTDHSIHAVGASPSRLPLVVVAVFLVLIALASLPALTGCALPVAEPGAVPTSAEISARASCQ